MAVAEKFSQALTAANSTDRSRAAGAFSQVVAEPLVVVAARCVPGPLL